MRTNYKRLIYATLPSQRLFLAVMVIIFTISKSLYSQGGNDERHTISGTITDSDTKKSMSGLSVSIPKMKIGAISNSKGEYSIKGVPQGSHSVETRMVGYQTSIKVVTIGTSDLVLNYEISSQALKGREIVVMGLTGEVKRDKLGNSISTVEGDKINKVVSTSAIDALAGRVTGAQVSKSSGTPGAGTFVTLRGRKSIAGSSEPLYVVDGVIIDNSYTFDPNGSKQLGNRAIDINPQDIESIEVLKGASAAAMYGSLAGNGVILITTKKGNMMSSEKPATITYSSSYTMDKHSGEFNLQNIYGQRIPYAAGTNGGVGKPGSTDSYGAKLKEGTTTFNHGEDVFRTGNSFEQSLSVSGGNGDINYLISGTLSNLEGTVISSDMDKRNIRLNLGVGLLPRLSLQTSSNYISSNTNLPQDGSNRSGTLLGGLRTPTEFDNSIKYESDGTQRRFAGYDNPLWSQENNSFNQNVNRFIHSSELTWNPIDWIKATGRIGLDRYDQTNVERLAVGARASLNSLGLIDVNRSSVSNYNLDLTLSASHNFSDNFSLNGIIGQQVIWQESNSSDVEATSTLPFYDQISAGSTKDGASANGKTKTVGLFASATATIFQNLNLTASIRRDGSSTFGKDNQFHNYPKFGISYTLSDESFMKDMKGTIDNLRIRGAYGEAGSPSLPGAYATTSLYGTYGFFDPWGRDTKASRNGFIGIRQGELSGDNYIVGGNENIQPELNIEREIGIDLGLFNNKIKFEANYSSNNVEDMILLLDIPASTGYDKYYKNAAAMYNRTIELNLGINPVNIEGFTWNTNFGFTKTTNMVTKLEGSSTYGINGAFTGVTNIATPGQPLGVFYGRGWLRDSTTGKIIYSTGAADDDYGNAYKGAPKLSTELLILGSSEPDFTASWENTFSLMNDITFSFLFDIKQGGKVWNGTEGALYNFGTHGDTKDRDEPWINEDGQPVMDVTDPNKPVAVTKQEYYQTYANGFNDSNEPHIKDGSYIKLRDISLGYNYHGLSEYGIETLNLSLSARNLMTISKYNGFDPEVNTFGNSEGRGMDYFTLPQSKSLRISLSLTY